MTFMMVCRSMKSVRSWANPAFKRDAKARALTLTTRASPNSQAVLIFYFIAILRFVSCRAACIVREGEGLLNYKRSCWAYCPDPDERRAPGPQSLVGFYCFPIKLIRLSRRGSNPLHINAGSASVILCRRPAARKFLSGFFFLARRFWFSRFARFQFEIFAVLQHRPRQPRVLRRDGDHRAPVAAPLLQ